MKKFAWFFSILIIAGVFFAGNIFCQDGMLKIASVEGKVLLKRSDSNEWVEAKIGDLLNKGDMIKTLEDGAVYLEFSPENGFSLTANSEFVIGDVVKMPPLVAEPYSEPAREVVASVMAPDVNQEGAASRI